MTCGEIMHKGNSPVREILKLSSRDIRTGIYQNRWKYLWTIPLILIFFFNFREHVNGFFDYGPHQFEPSFMDFCLYLFKGKVFTLPDPHVKYEIPIMWLTTQMYALYIIGSYPSDDRTRLGQQYLLRCTHSTSWYLAKMIYGLVSIGLFYLEILVIAFLVTVPISKEVFTAHPELVRMCSNIHLERHTALDLYRSVFVMPWLTAETMGQAYIFLQLLIRPAYAFLASLLYILCSDFYMSKFLIGNYSMIVRNVQENTFDGMTMDSVDPAAGIGIELLCIAVFWAAGKLILKKYDYLERE